MKQILITLGLLGFVGVINFILVASIFIYPFSPLAFLPLWLSILLILILYFVETVGIIKRRKIETQKFTTYFKYFVLGLLVTGLFLFIRDYVPKLIFRNLSLKQEQSISEGRSDIFSEVSVGEPKFWVKKYLENTFFDEYYFYVDIPITIQKKFTETQILNAFHLKFLSQKAGILPGIASCYGNTYIFSVLNLSRNNQQNPGTYTIRFKYSYSGKGCKENGINSLLNEKIVLTIVDGKDLKTFVVDNVELK